MKMVALPSGKQRCIHGPAVNVPSKLHSFCTVLPRLPSQSELIPLKLKRKLAYKGHYMYDYVTPEKILNALRWLKVHNPLYANVEINEEWANDADHDLFASLINSIEHIDADISEPVDADISEPVVDANTPCTDTANINCHSTSANNCDPVNKEPVNNEPATTNFVLSDPISTSELIIDEHSSTINDLTIAKTDNNFTIHDVAGDGNCLYNSVLYQLSVTNITVDNLRKMVGTYLRKHADLYMPFVTSPVASSTPYNHDTTAPDSIDTYISSISDPKTSSLLVWERRLTNGSWGDHVVIAALANIFNVNINVVHAREHACSVATIPPTASQPTCDINLGLLMQYHFVALES